MILLLARGGYLAICRVNRNYFPDNMDTGEDPNALGVTKDSVDSPFGL